ncbi:Phospholipase_D-nuclease N-terminal [Sinosporangium album]|uniref:Phospholipase_D-nuclease N-terminal n=1 Tax=Sinosporangium album TaxID=504805 RepID=A0A1G7U9J0_9ACTN|nr:PLDc N-terminal domain-containing protein [Sinosporangium album]SDG44123.1 Phospholipase_D-nuclease N-terminal [Sinosporangium album]
MPSVLIGLVLLAFWLYCLFDVITTPDDQVRFLPKILWVLVVVLVPLFGSLFWLLLGRPLGPKVIYRPQPRGKKAEAPKGPDDDPEFLKDLDRRMRGEDERG